MEDFVFGPMLVKIWRRFDVDIQINVSCEAHGIVTPVEALKRIAGSLY